MNNGKSKVIVYLCAIVFGVLGVYLTFFAGNTDKYDSQTSAYKIEPNESYDSEDGTIYRPIYYFKVDGRDYECKTNSGSSSYPNEKKNTVYYDSTDPSKCITEYEKSTSKFGGIVCLIATAVIVYFFIIKKPSNVSEGFNQFEGNNMPEGYQINEEDAEKVLGVIEKIQLIIKRVILGIIILVLLVFTLIDTAIFKQTIKARNYIETTATYVGQKNDDDDGPFKDYIYIFKDKVGNEHEIIISDTEEPISNNEIKIKYNENNPQEYYEEGATFDKSGIIWYIVKVVALILLIIVFFNKKILNKIGMSFGR